MGYFVEVENQLGAKERLDFMTPMEAVTFCQLIGQHPVTDSRKLTRVLIGFVGDSGQDFVTGEFKFAPIAAVGGFSLPRN